MAITHQRAIELRNELLATDEERGFDFETSLELVDQLIASLEKLRGRVKPDEVESGVPAFWAGRVRPRNHAISALVRSRLLAFIVWHCRVPMQPTQS